MRHGFVLPHGDARVAADMAREAERAGWDGFFVWEAVWGYDAWVLLAAAAMQTERIKLGTMLTPPSRMRPWDLAGKTMTVDRLSNGRVILAVGLGAIDTGFSQFGEVTDRRTRAELLDEALDIITGLWQGQPFSYSGKHYTVKECDFMPPPPPVQQPRIPIWVAGAYPSEKSMGRAAHYDGLLPNLVQRGDDRRELTPDDLRAMRADIAARRTDTTPYEIITEGTTPGDDPAAAAAKVRPWADAGATWWIESMWDALNDIDKVWARVRQGPPRVA